ncbi:riboflavin biosynthesis protein RibD, partial [bacterium]|nr:riboflavin biosynthesis protein RibD [bacterium]
MHQQNLDKKYMGLALIEAKKGLGFTNPNPMVGAVIVKNNQILATGYHKVFGEDHAEIDAIQKLKSAQLRDATIYVTLEPCCHHAKTPPCTDTIIKSGIKEVVVASLDEDPRVK